MLQNVYKTYRGGCMMLFYRSEAGVYFLGSAFLIHESGYLLTVAHILHRKKNLMVAPAAADEEFAPLSMDTVTPIPVEIAHVDTERDLALLKFESRVEITVPDHIIGNSKDIAIGESVAAIGFPYGYEKLHSQFVLQAVVSAKIVSHNNTRLLLFDTMVHDGGRGGPLVGVNDGRVVGVVSGRFDPLEVQANIAKESPKYETNISFAVAIEYAADLMDKEGLTVG